jgi:glycosyl transferase family 25
MFPSKEEADALRDSAKFFSKALDFTQSIPIWKSLSSDFPHVWTYAVDLAQDLRLAGRVEESDNVYRRAAMRFPDEFWVSYQWAAVSLKAREFSLAEQRSAPLHRLIRGFTNPNQTKLKAHAYWLWGNLAMARFSFAEAIANFSEARDILPDDAKLSTLLERAKLYARTADGFEPPVLSSVERRRSADYGAFVINLDRDIERFQKMEARFRDCPISLVRIAGIPGSYLPQAVLAKIMGGEKMPSAGTLGCLLTHVKAWETMLAKGLDVCLFLEDDAMPAITLPRNFSSLGIQADFDLCFVNNRMEVDLPCDDIAALPGPAAFKPIIALKSRLASFNAPGGDGYFLSAAGAKKLLRSFQKDGFSGDIDWRLIGYSVPKGAETALQPGSTAHRVLRQLHRFEGEPLNAFSLYPCLVNHDFSPSTREQETALRNEY